MGGGRERETTPLINSVMWYLHCILRMLNGLFKGTF